MVDQALQSLAPHRAGNWAFYDDGYYIHAGRVYLQGQADNSNAPTVTDTLFNGLPAAIRPAGTVTCTVVLMTEDPATPGVHPPASTTLTIGSDGAVTMALPPYVNVRPNGSLTNVGGASALVASRPDFQWPLLYTVALGGVSWPIGLDSDSGYGTESLAAYLNAADWENVDATIGLHGARVHLGGHVKAKNNRQRSLATTLPDRYTAAVDADGLDVTSAATPDWLVLGIGHAGRLDLLTVDGPPPKDADIYPLGGVVQDRAGFPNESQIAGLVTHPSTVGDRGTGGSTWAGAQPGGDRTTTAYAYRHGDSLSDSSPALTASIGAALGAISPLPEWVAIYVWAVHHITADSVGPPSDMALSYDGGASLVDAASGSVIGTHSPPGTGLQGWLAPSSYPGAGAYPYDPHNRASGLVWAFGTQPTTATMTLLGGSAWTGDGAVAIALVPLWETRRHWVLKDDVIDLTGAGWQAPFVAPLAPPTVPTNLLVGGQSGGPLRGKRNLGATAQRKLSSQARYSVANLVYLAVAAGLSGEAAAIGGAIGMAESGGDPLAVNYNPGPPVSRDRGLWQVNDYYHPEVSDACAFDPTCNAHAMYDISSGGTDWTPWSTYNSGAYLAHLAEAEAALAAMIAASGAGRGTAVATGAFRAGPRRHSGS